MVLNFQSCACRACDAVTGCEHKSALIAFACSACGHRGRKVVEMVSLPLQLSPQKEPFVRTLCICGAVRHLYGGHS